MNFWDWNYVAQILPDLLQASLKTLGITLVGFLIAVVLGLLLAIARRSRQAWLSWPVALLIEFIRSTPLLIQVYFLYYVLPNYGVNMTAMQAGIIGIGVHYACYLAEVYRGGLDSVARSQWEAVVALNFAPWTAYRAVILPQAMKIAIPPTVGFSVQVIKGTALTSIIGFVELSKAGTIVTNATFQPFTVYGLGAPIYFALCWPLSKSSQFLERKLNVAHRNH